MNTILRKRVVDALEARAQRITELEEALSSAIHVIELLSPNRQEQPDLAETAIVHLRHAHQGDWFYK